MRPGRILVVGYGNDLRGDDGAGRAAARAVAAWGLPQVEVLEVHQLTPELADPLAHAERAIFLDAHLAGAGSSVRVRSLSPETPPTRAAHTADPMTLLGLAKSVFGRAPEAWWVTIPARECAFGEQLSPVAARGVAATLEAMRPLLDLRSSVAEAASPAPGADGIGSC